MKYLIKKEGQGAVKVPTKGGWYEEKDFVQLDDRPKRGDLITSHAGNLYKVVRVSPVSWGTCAGSTFIMDTSAVYVENVREEPA